MEYIVNSNDLTSVANAIRTKGETSAPLAFPNGFVSAIEDIPTGGGGAEVQPLNVMENGTYTAPEGTAYSPVVVNIPIPNPSDYIYQDNEGYVILPSHKAGKVRFIDYDGTLLYSFSKDDIDEMESLPTNPTHDGLIAQGWNWSLANIKSYLTDNPDANVNVGQMYITNDGKTRIYITLDDRDALSPYLAIAINGTVSVDWGDDSTPNTMIGTSISTLIRCQHVYDNVGDYIISIEVVSGNFAFYGRGTNYGSCLVAENSSNNRDRSRLYSKAITKVNIGSNADIRTTAFCNCVSLLSVTIPDSVTSIGSSAFNNCFSLSSVTIPDHVTSIGSSAFNYCYSLSSITIPDSVTSIESAAFYGCSLLSSITIPDGVTSIVGNVFQNCYSLSSVTIPDSVTSIISNAFNSCYSLSSVTIPDSVTSIGSNAFSSCFSLSSATIPDSVTSIGSNAFSSCFSLSSVTILDGITSIASSAFQNCYTLSSITIPDSVTSIASNAFYNCSSLSSIAIPDSVTSIGASAFYGCYSLSSITIPDSATSIDSGAFSFCSISSVIIPDGVTSIANNAFYGCSSLSSVTIPDSVTSIGNSAFNSCYSLSSITIPDSVTSIGTQAFSICSGILDYHFKSATPPTLANTNAFSSIVSGTIIYVPYSSDHSILEAYKTATNWSTYASYIQEEPAP